MNKKKSFLILFRPLRNFLPKPRVFYGMKKHLIMLALLMAAVIPTPSMGFEVKVDKEKVIQNLKENDPEAYKITQKEGTEAPFTNKYNDEKREGIYVDRITMRPLFSSTHKYDSGSGWPSFYDVIDPKYVDTKKDFKLILPRTEVHSIDETHLGHVFEDGPEDKTGLRYCVNSKSLIFIPKEEMLDPKYEGQYEKYYEMFFGKAENSSKEDKK